MSYYQPPDELNYDPPKIQLHVPSDEKGKDLAKHLPYLAQINDPIFQNRVEDLINNDEDLQSYLFATEDLNRSLEDSLRLLVSRGKINDATKVRHEFEKNNADIKFFQQNDNPLDILFKEKAKFDVQNPIIGSLLEEINKGKITEKGRIEAVKGAPNPKDLEVEERFNNLFERKKLGPNDNIVPPKNEDDDDDDDDNDIDFPKIPDFYRLLQFRVERQVLDCRKGDLDQEILTMNGEMREHVKNIFSRFRKQTVGCGDCQDDKLI